MSGVERLSTEEKRKVKKVKEKARKDASSSAEQINKFEENTFYVAVKEVLDEYYEDKDNIQKEQIAEFKESVDAKAENLIEGYEAALEERQCAETLGYETEQIMVAFKEGTPYEEVQAITDCLGGEIDILDGTNRGLADYMQDGNLNLEDTLLAKINIGIGQTVDMAKESLKEIDCIEAVEPNKYKQVESVSTELTNDPYANQQYYLEQINVDGAWNAIANALGYCDYETNRAVIAIIDTGFDVTHSDLKNVLSNKSITTGEIDANGNFKSLFNCDIPYYSDHGSHVAGIIAAQTNNGTGIVGITNVYDQENKQYFNTCEIIGINAGKSSGTGAVVSTAREIEGIYYVIDLTKHQNKTTLLSKGHKRSTCLKRQVI